MCRADCGAVKALHVCRQTACALVDPRGGPYFRSRGPCQKGQAEGCALACRHTAGEAGWEAGTRLVCVRRRTDVLGLLLSLSRAPTACEPTSSPRSPFPSTPAARMTHVRGPGDTGRRRAQRICNGRLAGPPSAPCTFTGPRDDGTARGAPAPPHLLIDDARHPASALAPGAVPVPALATTVQWTPPPPSRRVLCSRAYDSHLILFRLHWGGGTLGRFWKAAGLP